MADAAAARREARRRRILENSQDRLQRIAGGKISSETCRGATPGLMETPETYEEIVHQEANVTSTPVYNGFVEHVPPLNLEGLVHDAPELGDFLQNLSGASTLLSSIPKPDEAQPAASTWERVTATKLDIMLVSLLVQITFSMSSMGADSASLFLPLMVYDVTKIYLRRNVPDSGVLATMLLMNGISQSKVKSLTLVVKVILTFVQDIFTFLFFTVCIQALFICLFTRN